MNRPKPGVLLDKSAGSHRIEHMGEKWISASEISHYVFCHKAWWLQHIAGASPANTPHLTRGVEHHAAHNRLWRRAAWYRWLAYVLLVVALGILALWLATL